MMLKLIGACAGLAVPALLVAGLVHAQNAPPAAGGTTPPARALAPASKDPNAAPAGTYRLDLEHVAVVARIPHRGMSFNVVRFGARQGTLRWDPAKPAAIALDVTIDTKPYYQPIIYRMPPEGEKALNVAQYPQARFVSTAVRVKDGARATIEGKLTLRGVTKPAVIHAELVGVGKSMEGAPTAGFTGSMVFNWGEFNDDAMARIIGNVTIVLDAEFIKG